jgi:hypothetical protein
MPARIALSILAVALSMALPGTALAEGAQRLFVIARSKNANIVHYDLRTDARGDPDARDPLDVYWVLHEQSGRRESLSWFEKRLAYGWQVVTPVRKAGFVVRLVAFDQRLLRVIQQGSRYRALLRIAGRSAYLNRIFVGTSEGGVVPRVLYLELFGVDAQTGVPIRERLEND